MVDLMTAATSTFTSLTTNVTVLYVSVIAIVAIGVAFTFIRRAMRGRG